MRTYDDWLEAPYRDADRNGEAMEALEIQFQDSDEFQDCFENWQQDEMSEFQPLCDSPMDTFLTTSTYARALDAYIEAWVANNSEPEWEVDDTPESDEALRAWDEAPVLSLRKRVVRLLAKVVGR